MRIWLTIAAIVAASAGVARADSDRQVLEQVCKCADVTEAADRLKCFDAAVPHAQAALAAPEPPPAQTATAQTGQDSGGVLAWFGFDQPVTKPEDFGKPPEAVPGAITRLTAATVEFGRTPTGRAIFILDNGQVWRQVDGDTDEVRDPYTGEALKVAIERGFFGSYSLTIEGRNGLVKVRRVK